MHIVHVDVHDVIWYTMAEVIDMPCTEARKRANAAYNRRQDNIMIRPSKDEGTRIRQAAADAGMSVQAFILDTLRARIGTGDTETTGQTESCE